MSVEVKTIGSSGQISLGKEHAGQTVTVEQIGDGAWLIRTARVVPAGCGTGKTQKLLEALSWAAKNPPRATNLQKLEAKLKKRR